MNRDEIKESLDSLREWREAYYNGTPLVIDAVYDAEEDAIREAIQELPAKDALRVDVENFLSGVGAPVPSEGGWVKVTHKVAMGSLNKAQPRQDINGDQDHSELRAWLSDLGISGNRASAKTPANALLAWSDKCDGISIALYYENGNLVRAVTRGDGEVGEDITPNVLKMKGIVPRIKGFDGFIRGEIVLKKSDWKAHFPTYANPRNAASGIAKRQSGGGQEHLTVLHYQMIRFSGKPIPTKYHEFKVLEHLGAEVPSWGVVDSLRDIERIYEAYVAGQREALDYDIDGLVVEVNNTDDRENYGTHNNRPKGAIAYKFPHDKKPTILKDIVWQVGNTGRITPVAVFEPVKLAGATVTNASLHNLTNIDKLTEGKGFRVGDKVVVSRRNDVIPYVESLLRGDAGGARLAVPEECPECGASLVRKGEFLICPAEDTCPAQIAGAIKTWVKKLGLKGVGTTLIDALCEQGIISDAADLYTLDAGELAEVRLDGRRVGSTATAVVRELHSKKELPLHVFVGSLNIPLCSRSTMKTIVDAGYDTLDKMRAATLAEIAAIPGMGAGRAQAFVDGMRAKAALMDKLIANGVTIQAPAEGKFKGMSFCFTGVRDPALEAKIEEQGGTIKSGVSRKLTTLIAKNPKSNSGKAKKARTYGIEVISLDEMWSRVR